MDSIDLAFSLDKAHSMNLSSRCVYQTAINDPETNTPLWVLDSTFFPPEILLSNNSSSTDLAGRIGELMQRLPQDKKFTLIFFTNGFNQYDSGTPTLGLLKFLKMIPQNVKDLMIKILICHNGNMLTKSLFELLGKFWGYRHRIVHCQNLSILSQNCDLTQIPIALQTYIIDKYQYNNRLIISSRHFEPIYSRPLSFLDPSNGFNQFSKIFNNLMGYLTNKKLNSNLNYENWVTIIKCQILNDETKVSVDILSNCLKRDQCIVLSDYSFLEHFLIIVKFILKLSQSNQPLINPKCLIENKFDLSSLKNVNSLLNNILMYQNPILKKYGEMSNNDSINKYDNCYILIKIFKLFKYILVKLTNEAEEVFGITNDKEMEKLKLKLILSYTKILYSETNSNSEEDVVFDHLFRFIQAVMEKYDDLKILKTNYSIEDFKNYLSIDDFLSFENFKNELLGYNHINQSVLGRSPIKSSSRDQRKLNVLDEEEVDDYVSVDMRNGSTQTSAPTPPLPRKTPQVIKQKDSPVEYPKTPTRNPARLNTNLTDLDFTPNKNINPQEADVAEEEERIEDEIDALDFIAQDDDEEEEHTAEHTSESSVEASEPPAKFKLVTPIKPQKPVELKSTPRSARDPSSTVLKDFSKLDLTPQKNLVKYTSKDLAIMDEKTKQMADEEARVKLHKEVVKGVGRGERKVSKLAKMYEEKFL